MVAKRKTTKRKPRKRKPKAAKAEPADKGGRPKWEPTKTQIEEAGKLAQIQCTLAEIAAWMGVGTSTIDRRMKDDEDFAAVIRQGWAKSSISFKRLLWKHASSERSSGTAKALGLLGARFGMDEKHTVTIKDGTDPVARLVERVEETLTRAANDAA